MLHDFIFFFTGLLVGSINAVSGGGMLIGFPIMLAMGMSPLTANITANVSVLPGNIGAAFSYRRALKKVPKVYLLLLIPAIIGAAIGAILLRHTSFASFDRLIPILILFAVVLFAMQPFIYLQIQKHLSGPKNKLNSIRPLFWVWLAVLPLSVYGGYFGAGFGFIMLAFLGFTKLRDHMHRMNAIRTMITVFIAGISILCLFTSHRIDWQHGLIMGAGTLLGGYYGGVAIQKVSSQALRVMVIALGLTTATYLALRSY